MDFDKIIATLPHPRILQLLKEKAAKPDAGNFSYLTEFSRLYTIAEQDIDKIPATFTGYTPHNVRDHIARLFRISEVLIGEAVLTSLSAVEVFALAVGLLTHDWGMRVTKEEMKAIRGEPLDTGALKRVRLLEKESERVRLHSARQGLVLPEKQPWLQLDPLADGLSDDQRRLAHDFWPDYLRNSHALRGAQRVAAEFEGVDARLGRHLAEIVEGHWLDFREFDRRDSLLEGDTFGATNQRFHVGLVALFVRLVDLFDIANDRTPEAARRSDPTADELSQLEWIKHSCISPVLVEKTEHGDRRIIVRGEVFADNTATRSVRGHVWLGDYHSPAPVVWAELESLRIYCEEQLHKAVDGIRRRVGKGIAFDLAPTLEWRVSSKNFHAVSIRFEFARMAMFRYLTSELYEGDTHVFLRELLQNAIDAIRLRRALDEKAGRRDRPDRAIYFRVQHGTEGDATVSCTDYGIGMDEYVVRNYLAVAGTSYYSSGDFQSLGCTFTPISRFGIGLLSCFMVADRVEVRTRRLQSGSEDVHPLHIDIPRIGNPFHIYADTTLASPGTTVTIHVRGEKLREQWGVAHPQEMAKLAEGERPTTVPLRVRDYLECIAGFVREPIVVDEDGARAVIVHPNYEQLPEVLEEGDVLPSLEREATRLGLRWQGVSRIQRGFPWKDVVRNEYLEEEVEALSHENVDLVRDLGPELAKAGFTGFEGWLDFPQPKDEMQEFSSDRRSISKWGSRANTGRWSRLKGPVGLGFRGRDLRDQDFWIDGPSEAPSARRQWCSRVFRDGLLVGRVPRPKAPVVWGSSYLAPRAVVNVPGSGLSELNPSRSHIRGWDNDWANFIWKAMQRWERPSKNVEQIVAATVNGDDSALCERFFRLGRVAALFGLPAGWLAHHPAVPDFPVLLLEPDGSASIQQEAEIRKAGHVWEAPARCPFDFGDALLLKASRVSHWQSDQPCVPSATTSGAIGAAWDALRMRLGLTDAPSTARWLVPPAPWNDVIPQVRHNIRPRSSKQDEATADVGKSGRTVDQTGFDNWRSNLRRMSRVSDIPWWVIPDVVCFLPPFSDLFATGNYLNTSHAVTTYLARLATEIARLGDMHASSELIRVVSELGSLLHLLESIEHYSLDDVRGSWDNLTDAVKEAKLGQDILLPPALAASDIGPLPYDQTAVPPADREDFDVDDDMRDPAQDWGMPLSANWKPRGASLDRGDSI